ncbi:hypothetical protein M758_6G212300 [Ceratodon purpureus]|uniref:Uncharacterized protein n=1 Tax=Ceratodon purpureus TaxID=3225 RepID=A0A8T0HKB7_CERPU|nr:hypothetical protein KC19_6G222000 [Ceratodon purpureus]KAG0614896.1 hypothetical protein M758_6G212300 [Ceratodon purpureus]
MFFGVSLALDKGRGRKCGYIFQRLTTCPSLSGSGRAGQVHAVNADELVVMSSQSVTLQRLHLCTSFRVDFSRSNRLALFRDVCGRLHMTCSAWQFSHAWVHDGELQNH